MSEHKFLLRIPENIHRKLEQESIGLDMSLNHVILRILSGHYGVELTTSPRARKKPRPEKMISDNAEWLEAVKKHGNQQAALDAILRK